MTLIPVTIEDFAGLRLRPEPGETQGAISMLNADLLRDQTQVGSRGGLVKLGTGTAAYHRLAHVDSASVLAFRNKGTSTLAIEIASFALATGVATTATAAGGPTSRVTSVASIPGKTIGGEAIVFCQREGSVNDGAQKLTALGLGVTSISASYGSPRYAAVTPISDRPVVAHFTSSTATPGGANGSLHTIWFGDPGAAFVSAANNWVDLDPGDGSDGITGVCTWRELTFAIKRSRLYVFYSESVDTTGGVVFNYRAVELPERARATASGGGENMVVGGKAVYLLLADGVYATTGGVPVPISRAIKPIFDGTADSSMVFPTSGDWNIGYADGRVYINYTVAGNQRTLVYDEQLDEWFLWDVSAGQGALPANIIGWVDTNGLPATYVGAGGNVYRWSPTATTDDGSAITSSYLTGDLFGPNDMNTKRLRRAKLEGSGTVSFVWAPIGRRAASDSAVTITMPANGSADANTAARGDRFGAQITATGAWTLNRITAMLATR